MLTNAAGRSVYIFTRDTVGVSACSGTCTNTWIPVLTLGAPVPGEGAAANQLSTLTRPEGAQVAYSGWPLYYNVRDTAAGDLNGQNVGTIWFTISGEGSIIQDVAQLKVTQNPTLGAVITDRSGRTLYARTTETANTTNCTGACALTWPPALTIGNGTAGDGANIALFGNFKRADGSTQLSYNGHALYFFSRDTKPGDTVGQNVGTQWYALSPAGDYNRGSAPPVAATATPVPAPSGAVTQASIASFVLPTLSVRAGATVRWTNLDSAPHTVTSQSSAPDAFNGTLSFNGTFSFTFTKRHS